MNALIFEDIKERLAPGMPTVAVIL